MLRVHATHTRTFWSSPFLDFLLHGCHNNGSARKQLIAASEQNKTTLECGTMPNVMVALPNIGGALCSTPQSLADAHY